MKKWTLFPSAAQSPNGPLDAQDPAPIPAVTTADAKMFGLENFGNTCYANSVLQALYFCGPFRDLLVQYPDASHPDISSMPSPQSPPIPPPQSHLRPKPGRKQSIAEPPPPAPSIISASAMPSTPSTLLSALRSLYVYISQNPAEKGTIAPRAFIDKLKELNELFRSTMHQDAHEFLNYLLNQIVEEMDDDRKKLVNGNGHGRANGTPPTRDDLSASVGSLTTTSTATTGPNASSITDFAKSTLVHRLFEGTLTSETRCLTCETVSSRDESFLDLSIDIEQNSSVTACLRQFSASEMLYQRNKFFCDSCCDLQEAEKRMKIKKLPHVLALHLKRFKYQEDLGKYIKLAYRVAFPLELRLFNTTDGTTNPDRLYELFAIVVHIGNGPHHGHYVSIVKARGTWYLFDDDKIEAIKETDIPKYFGDSNSGSAYVLYYQAADLDYTALGLRKVPEHELGNMAASETHVNSASTSSVKGSRTLAPTAESIEHGNGPSSSISPVSATPSLPPGLIQDGHAHPTAPASLSAPRAQPSLEALKFSLSNSVEPSQSSPTVPPTPSGTSGRSFFGSLRNTPSLRKRPSSSSGALERKSVAAELPPPVPFLPTSAGVNSTTRERPATADNANGYVPPASPVEPLASLPPSIAASPSTSTVASQSTAATAMIEKKGGASGLPWFKPNLKGSRSDREKSSSIKVFERSSSVPGSGATDDLSSLSTSSSDGANIIGDIKFSKRIGRRASDAVLATSHAQLPLPSSTTARGSAALRPVYEHKRSTPEVTTLNQISRSEKRSSLLTRRPATAGDTSEKERMADMSLLPSPLPMSPRPNPDAPSEGSTAVPETTEDPQLLNTITKEVTSLTPHRADHPLNEANLASDGYPRILYGPPSAFTTTNGTSSTQISSETSSSSISNSHPPPVTKAKRASRKLSFSSAMLGFGKKDKERERDLLKERDGSGGKHRPQSPAFSQASSQRNGKV